MLLAIKLFTFSTVDTYILSGAHDLIIKFYNILHGDDHNLSAHLIVN